MFVFFQLVRMYDCFIVFEKNLVRKERRIVENNLLIVFEKKHREEREKNW